MLPGGSAICWPSPPPPAPPSCSPPASSPSYSAPSRPATTTTNAGERPCQNALTSRVGEWQRVSPKYVVVVIVEHRDHRPGAARLRPSSSGWSRGWAFGWIAAAAVVVITVVALIIAPRRARSIGYRLRDDDLLFRRGIMFQRFVSVPYGRMQLIDINRGPVGRMLGLADLKFVTAAASTGVVDPGAARTGGGRAARPARRAGGEQPGGAVTGAAAAAAAPHERAAERFTDGEWHRLHPATPLLRGGIVFIAVLGFVLSNLRERLVGFFVGAPDYRRRPARRDLQPRLGGLGAARRRRGAARSASARFYLSWRMHSFRITRRRGRGAQRHPVPHAAQGAARPHPGHQRRPPGDRAALRGGQARHLAWPGTTRTCSSSYLGSSLADGLRGDVLRLASGVRAAEATACAHAAVR